MGWQICEEWALLGGKMRAAKKGWQHHNLNLARPNFEIWKFKIKKRRRGKREARKWQAGGGTKFLAIRHRSQKNCKKRKNETTARKRVADNRNRTSTKNLLFQMVSWIVWYTKRKLTRSRCCWRFLFLNRTDSHIDIAAQSWETCWQFSSVKHSRQNAKVSF